ncbi:MAG: amino acid ABC transporter permease/ATP-binding protein [Curvibacter sp.]|nr:amino acid ABC transporter permease/ATP-binding protein [Curvibacter sp.]
MRVTASAPSLVALPQSPLTDRPLPASTAHSGAAPRETSQEQTVAPADGDYSDYRVVPARHAARWLGSAVSVLLLLALAQSVLGNPRWGWPVFAEWFFSEPVLVGLGRTLLLTALGALLGFSLGALLAAARVSRSPLLASLAWAYIWLFRSIPLLVLLLILNNLGYLYETVWLGIPYTQLTFFSYPTTQLISPFMAAVLGLSLNQAAFSAEIIRSGVLSVDQGQWEAAAALGLPRRRQALRIVLPQAMRTIVPTAFNDLIALAKGTANVYILALPELFYTIQVIYRRNLEVVPLLMVATVWYLIILTVLSLVQSQVERRYARGALRQLPKTWWQTLRPGRHRLSAPTAPAAAAPGPRAAASAWQSRAGGGEVRVHGVSKSFGHHKVLDDVSLTVPAGSVTVIIGPSGSGKSTLLRSINHLERVDAGTIAIDGELIGYRKKGQTLYELKEKDILRRRVDVGMVFQQFNLFPHLSVLENLVEAPVAVRGAAPAEARALALELLARVGLSDKADAYPRQLSGGQQQRVAIARALALKPKVLLFDEPTSALDPELVGEVLDVIKELARSGTTLIVVTHEIGFAREVADHLVFMEQGRLLEQGAPERLLSAPQHARTREFLAKVL